MYNFSIVLPTCRRYQHFNQHINHLLNLEPSPEKIFVTHVENQRFTDRFDFEQAFTNDKVEIQFYEDDPGLIHTKFVPAFEFLDTDFIFVCDDDIFPGQRYPQNVFESYNEKPGIYCGMGFRYGENEFSKKVYGGYKPYDYIWKNEITEVDAPGQSFFFRKSDIKRFDNGDLPEFGCTRCHDDLILGWIGFQTGTRRYVAPHSDDKKDQVAVRHLKEGDLNTQALVSDNHPSDEHKNQFVQWLNEDTLYTRVEDKNASLKTSRG